MKIDTRLSQSFRIPFLLVLITMGLLKVSFLSSLYSQPGQIHLSLADKKSPKETAPVLVTWCSDNSSGNQYIQYGLTESRMKERKAANTNFSGRLVFNAALKNLKTGSSYFYRCGSDKDGWSPIYSFKSEPDTGSFRVAVIGDTQNNENNENFRKTKVITDLVRKYSPSFTLHMGDIVDNGSAADSWKEFLTVTQDLNATSPLMPVLGNHDIQNTKGDEFQKPFQNYYALFNLPGDEVNYSFTYANVRFIGIFSGCAQAAAETGQVKYEPGSAEYNWLDDELTKAENDKKTEWIIVWMHYPVYSAGWSNISKWKENVLPLLEKHRVDLCLAGHRHIYERHFPIKNGIPMRNGSGSSFKSSDGTIYITNGTAGGNPTGTGGKDLPTIAFTPDTIMYSFGIMDINNKSITYSVYSQDNILIDKFILIKSPKY